MAIHDPCALLGRLLLEPAESGWLELKKNNLDPDELGSNVSALANGAMLAGKDRAFILYGVENGTKLPTGTDVRLETARKGGEALANWLSRLVEPRLSIELRDFECDGRRFGVVSIEPSYDRPVKFSGTAYVRVGESTRKLAEFPDRERALWLATSRRRFEEAVAATNVTAEDALEKLDVKALSELTQMPAVVSIEENIKRLVARRFLIDNLEGRYDITNLGAILLAKDVAWFPSIAGKTVRVVKYSGIDKARSEFEQVGTRGYAAGFTGLMTFLLQRLPKEERIVSGIRRTHSLYPELVIRETLANALIHQDLTISGVGPLVEIYDDRIEISNPGGSLVSVDRMLDERRSRNENLAAAMREFGLCEERGSGLDRTIIEIESNFLPAPEFISSESAMRVVLFGPRPYSAMAKRDKLRAAFHHCILRWLRQDFMSNSSLRARFSLSDDEYQSVSALIAELVKSRKIVPADPAQGKRNARYVPYWAAPK